MRNMRTISTRRYLVVAGHPSLAAHGDDHLIWDCVEHAYILGKGGARRRFPSQAHARQHADTLEADNARDSGPVPMALSVPTQVFESWVMGNPPAGLRPAIDTTITDTDELMIRWLRTLSCKHARHRRAEAMLQLPALARWEAMQAAHELAGVATDAHNLVDALTKVIATHPNRRPVPCGAQYLVCQVGDGKTEQYGVVDMYADTEPRDTPWVCWGSDGTPVRWPTFEQAARAAATAWDDWDPSGQRTAYGTVRRMPRGIAQQAWQPSVVRMGDRISGKCVTYGSQVVGHVLSINGPFREDSGHYRYQVAADDGRTSIVFARQLL